MIESGIRISILIPDGENELLTNHVKDCFASAPIKVRLFVMSNNKFSPSRFSRYVYNYAYYPKANHEHEWIANINAELLKHHIDLIMPIFEDGIRTLIKFKKYVKENHKLVILSSLEDFEIANNKALLAKHLEINKISGPKCYPINPDDLSELDSVEFPILAKPLNRTDGGSGIVRLKQKKDLINYLQNKIKNHNIIFQEFIEGYDIDCSVLCKDGDIYAFTIQKGILYSSKKYAPPIGVEFLYNGELYQTIKRLMKTLNWSGVAHIDMRYDVDDAKYKVIEVNTRFWGSLDASLAAGVNFPYLYYLLSTNNVFVPPKYDQITFLGQKGILKRLTQKASFLMNFKFIWNYTAFKYMAKDPVPLFTKLINLVYSKAKRVLF